jgi:peptidoglycan/xylan/chitin deacetylase (PgdA/CDA1 family)
LENAGVQKMNRPSGPREWFKRLIPESLLKRDLGATAANRVLLTFDDGPDPDVTPAVLSRLQAYGARAIFFVVGRRVAASPATLKLIREAGHRIGNHSYAHANSGDPWFGDYLDDLKRCQAIVHQAVGEPPSLFRPPKGHLSFTSLVAPRLIGLSTVNWSMNVRDWSCRTEEQARTAAISLADGTRPGDIILLHDDNRFVIQILDFVLPRFAAKGFDLHSAVDSI